MEDLIIEKGANTPAITFMANGVLRIEGRSIPENPAAFYEKAFEWLNDYKTTNPKKIELHVDLENFNSSSSIILMNIFKTLRGILNHGADVRIHWHNSANDEEMIESGRYYESILKMPFFYEMN
ncbi:MAG TPA: DUF1987 domain-containing protein [Bacteroidales bacterium]